MGKKMFSTSYFLNVSLRASALTNAIVNQFPQLKSAKDNYLLQEQSIFSKDANSDIIITLGITSTKLIADMRTQYLASSSSRALAGVWAQNILPSRITAIKLNEFITLTNASFPSTPRTVTTTNACNNTTFNTIVITTKTVTSTADHTH
jgi:hypothetical protein